MKIHLILVAFSFSAFAQSPSVKKEEKKADKQIEKQEFQDDFITPITRHKKKKAFPRGPYKDGVYQYEWEKEENSGEAP